MSNDAYYTDQKHPSYRHPSQVDMPSQHLSVLEEARIRHAQLAFKDYYCPFCGEILFRGKVRDFKMACHNCNQLVDSKKLEE